QRSVLILDPANGQQLICGDLPPSTSSATSMFLLSDRLLLTGPWGVRHFSLIGLQEFPSHWNFSNPALLVFQKDNTVGALDENRNLWIKKSLDLEFQKQFEGWKFEDLSPSAEETFWAIGFSVAENYRQAVGEFSLREGFLRELSQVSMPGFPLQIEFNPDSKVLFLHFRSEEADSVILGIYKSPLDERWREFFRRRILLPDGKLPDGFEFLPRSLNFASEAGLEIASKVRNWRLVYRISGEVSLELESGLRVADLMRTEYADAVQAKMEEDTLLLRVLEPGATLIWKFSGLPQKIAWLDGGEVIWPPPAPPPGSN
ncbi:MAG: hypothetical protein NZL93_02905, partial [Chthoniobacterales bacterium]|nr:hypothetical protein [Chthoniobacterales bacterium]